jgi:hypothetical protein
MSPQAGQAGQPAAQPGTAYPAQPGAGPYGATSSISIKGILIAAAAIVAVIVAVVAAFLLLRPDPPQQTAAQQPPPKNNPAPGTAARADAAPSGPWLRGTYHVAAPPGWPEHDVTATSDCPSCDATVTSAWGTLVVHSAGDGWTVPNEYCGAISFTPTVVVNGIVQEMHVSACAQSAAHTWTRVGD